MLRPKALWDRFRRDETGKVKFLTVVILAALAGGGYYLAMWGPLFLDHLEVKKRCEESVNSTWRYHDTGKTRSSFLAKIHAIKKIDVDVGGVTEQRPAIDPDDRDVQVELDTIADPPILSIDAAYPRTVKMPFLDREKTFWFDVHCEVDTSEVNWD